MSQTFFPNLFLLIFCSAEKKKKGNEQSMEHRTLDCLQLLMSTLGSSLTPSSPSSLPSSPPSSPLRYWASWTFTSCTPSHSASLPEGPQLLPSVHLPSSESALLPVAHSIYHMLMEAISLLSNKDICQLQPRNRALLQPCRSEPRP